MLLLRPGCGQWSLRGGTLVTPSLFIKNKSGHQKQIRLITNRSAYRRYTRLSRIFSSLETELYRLPRLNFSVPANIAGTIRITAADRCVPTVCHACPIGVIPVHTPPVDHAVTLVGNANCASKTVAPLIGDNVGATAAATGCAAWWRTRRRTAGWRRTRNGWTAGRTRCWRTGCTATDNTVRRRLWTAGAAR